MIIEERGNIVDFWLLGNVIGITTNGFVKDNGRCVMGRGIALSIRDRVPDIDLQIGWHIRAKGNVPQYFPDAKIFTFPVKHNWWEKADLELIAQSAEIIAGKKLDRIDFVRPGCGNGKLDWRDVRPVLDRIFVNVDAHVWSF